VLRPHWSPARRRPRRAPPRGGSCTRRKTTARPDTTRRGRWFASPSPIADRATTMRHADAVNGILAAVDVRRRGPEIQTDRFACPRPGPGGTGRVEPGVGARIPAEVEGARAAHAEGVRIGTVVVRGTLAFAELRIGGSRYDVVDVVDRGREGRIRNASNRRVGDAAARRRGRAARKFVALVREAGRRAGSLDREASAKTRNRALTLVGGGGSGASRTGQAAVRGARRVARHQADANVSVRPRANAPRDA
jgi:hypothetical protein